MVAILGGLGAAAAWAVAMLTASRAARLLGAPSVLAWVLFTGLAIVLPWAALEGLPDGLDAGSATWLLLAGAGNVVGLLCSYSAMRTGKVALIAPIVSTEGAIAAVLAVLSGEDVAAGAGVALVVVAAGIALAAVPRGAEDVLLDVGRSWRVPGLALSAATAFGISIYATGRASAELPIAWAVLPPRVLGVLVVFVPLAVTSRLVLTRAALPFVVASGVAEVVGFASYAVGSRDSVAVAAVLASQFAAIAAVAAYVLFRERLGRLQLAGVVTIVAGVAALTWLQA
jgi:drug/metabolite transporter (DMT)-like permease